MPPEYATAAAAASAHGGTPAIYGSHPAPHATPHYCAPAVTAQDFYAATGPALAPLHHELIHHHPVQVHEATPLNHGSPPDSGMRGSADRSESIEDRKSESSSWKGDDSGENGEDREGLSNLRDEKEESSGSEITLKF